MATSSTLNRSPSDFSAASVISLGRSTHTDVEDLSETTPLLSISDQNPQRERNQGDCKLVAYNSNCCGNF